MPVAAWSADIPFQDRFWRLLYTDRSLFRTSDTIEAWGLLQPRDGSAIPEAELRLDAGICYEGDATCAPTAIVSVPISPKSDTGVFTASVPIAGLPTGEYELGLWVGEHRVAATSLSVGIIRKPAYQLDVDHRPPGGHRRRPGRGDHHRGVLRRDARAGRRDPVASMRYDEAEPVGSTTTGADGTGRLDVVLERTGSQWDWQEIAARPAGPEEGTISASTQVLVFGSGVVLDGQATLDGTSLRIDGALHGVDLERLERELRAGNGPRPPAARAGRRRRHRQRPDRGALAGRRPHRPGLRLHRQEGGPDLRLPGALEDRSATRRVTTDDAGRFVLRVAVPVAGHAYEVTLSAADADGRTAELHPRADQVAGVSQRGDGPAIPSPTSTPGRAIGGAEAEASRSATRSRRPSAPTVGGTAWRPGEPSVPLLHRATRCPRAPRHPREPALHANVHRRRRPEPVRSERPGSTARTAA